MKNRRSNERRVFTAASQYPLLTQRGNSIISDRRRLPTRRVNDIDVKELGYREFIAILKGQNRQDQLVYFDIESPIVWRD
jgi:hypothetical protein